MSRTRSLVIAIVSIAAPLDAQQAGTVEFRAGGIPVIFKPVSENQVIAVQLYLKGGNASITPAHAGIERFIGAVSVRGSKKYTREQFAARAAATGAEVASRQTYDHSVMTLRAVRDYWDDSWDLFIEAALHPTFPDTAVTLVRAQLLSELRRRDDSPDGQLSRLADSVFFAGHVYGIDPAAAVASLTRDDLVRWHRERMTKENLLLVVVGNISRTDLETKVRHAFSHLPARGAGARSPDPLTLRERAVRIAPRALPTNYAMGVFAAPTLGDPDYVPMRVATEILSNRLFEEIRSKRGLSRSTSARINGDFVNTGRLYLTAVDLDTAFKVMRHEVERLKSEPVPAKRLAETVNVFLTRYFLDQETNSDQATALGTCQLIGGGWRRAATFLERVRAVTPAEVQRVARKYLKNVRFAVVGDSTRIDTALFTSM